MTTSTPTRWRPRRPRSRRGLLLAATGVLVVLLAGGFAAAYLVLLGGSSPPPLTLSPRSSASGAASAAPLAASKVAGTWTVASGSVAGYRVREKLADLPAQSEAVGRTSAITGTTALSDSGGALSVTAASFSVDVTALTSDRSMRDRRIHSIGLQSDQFPTASFVLTAPLAVPAAGLTGQEFGGAATGRLSIHGVTREESILVRARLSGAQLEVVGSITFPWSDFGMEAPSIGGFVSVTDQATMEFDLHLSHA